MTSLLKKALSVILMLGTILTCLAALAACDRRQVPVYEGMEITDKSLTSQITPNATLTADGDFSEGVEGDLADDGSVPEDPFPEDEDTAGKVESVAGSTIEVVGSGEEMYYTKQNRDIYITIKINNPDKFEILSFTFNGEKYSDYMFEEGSDLENIIIKVDSGLSVGVVEYTIDAMKYIDENNAIKDVIMAGDKTVKVGVRVRGQVVGEVENMTVDSDSISCYAIASDQYGLIEYFEGKAYAVVFDGQRIVGFKELEMPVDENGEISGAPQGDVSISGLKAGQAYLFGIVAFYDDLDGNGFGPKVIYEHSFRTQSILSYKSMLVGTEAADFEFGWGEQVTEGEILSLKLYQGNELVRELDTDATRVDGLLSGAKYRLVAEYKNKSATESIYAEFTTESKKAPILDEPSIDLVSGDLSVRHGCIDNDGTVTSVTSELYLGSTVVASSENGRLDVRGLALDSEYRLVLVYKYDLNDGEGEKSKTLERVLKTAPYFDLGSLRILNTEDVFAGDTVYFQATLDNPSYLDPISVTVNGVACPVEYNGGKVYFELVSDADSTEGLTEFTVERVDLMRDSDEFCVAPSATTSASIYLNTRPELERVSYVDAEGNAIDFAFSDDEVYLLLEFENISDYDLTEVTLSTGVQAEIEALGDGKFKIPAVKGTGWCGTTVTEVDYENSRISASLTGISVSTEQIYVVSGEINYVSNAEELLAMAEGSGGEYYELTADIDLTDTLWQMCDFSGVLNGNGHTISGYSMIKSYKNESATVGLFSSATGFITNLTLSDFYIKASVSSTNYSAHSAVGGILTGYATGRLRISNCTLTDSCVIEINNYTAGGSIAGGFIGGTQSLYGTRSELSSCSSSAKVKSTGTAGGLIGQGASLIKGCTSLGEVKGMKAGGIVGAISGSTTVTECESRAKVTGSEYAGGIVATGGGVILGCINRGDVTGEYNDVGVGGIIGHCSFLTIGNCKNYGRITGRQDVGGIVGKVDCSVGGSFEGYALYNAGEIETGSGGGGIVGHLYANGIARLTDSENRGKVSGVTSIGGIVGTCSVSTYSNYTVAFDIERCVSIGDVVCSSEHGGGIVGYASVMGIFNISNSVSFADVKGIEGTRPKKMGGIIGGIGAYTYGKATVTGCAGAGIADGIFSGNICAYVEDHTTNGNGFSASYNLDGYDEVLDTMAYYVEVLGFDEEVWCLDSIDTQNGKYPTLAE